MTGPTDNTTETMEADLNELAACDDILRTGETQRDVSFDTITDVDSYYEQLFIEAFENDTVRSVDVSMDGTELVVETEQFYAKGHLDETTENLCVVAGHIERNVEDAAYLLLEMEDNAHEVLAECGDARKQYYEWQQAEPMGAAALTAGERNPHLG